MEEINQDVLIEYEVCKMRISDEVDKKTGRKKGICPGQYIGEIKAKGMIAPGTTIKVKGKSRRVRCVDIHADKRILIVEG